VGLGAVHASHARDDTGFRRVHVGHDHSVGAGGLGGGSSAVRSIISGFGLALCIVLEDDEGIGFVIGFTVVGVLGGAEEAIPIGFVVRAGVGAIPLGPAVPTCWGAEGLVLGPALSS